MGTESTSKEKLSVTDIVIGRFMEKILEAEEFSVLTKKHIKSNTKKVRGKNGRLFKNDENNVY